ncbi:hypothetical protein HID58_074670 [Brassica napus]|uniref:Uncharacterized protein n=1 Tax=Brassica napus TaxID=3708 RepID=A0ABQ7YHH5_BRANA|nr:hypothetical protein HID58_074670 [Brassica napus]
MSSEHDVSMCFSEHGGTLLMSWRSLHEPALNIALAAIELMSSGDGRLGPLSLGRSYVLEYFLFLSDLGRLLLAIAAGSWRQDPDPGVGTLTRGQGPCPGGRDPEPGGKNPKPRGRNSEAGSWSYLFMEYFSPTAGNNMIFFIGLREFYNGIKLLLEFRVGRRLVARAFKLPYRDETLPPWLGLVGVGRKFDGDAGNVCIKGDASSHTPDACSAHDFSLHFLRLSGSMNRVEECMGQDPGIMRGRILARPTIRGMGRFNKTRRPKLRILMLDSTGLTSYLMLLEFLASSRDCTLAFGGGRFSMFVLVPEDNLVDSWYRSRSLGHDPGHALPKSEGLEINPVETHRFEDVILLKSEEPDGCVDLQGDLLDLCEYHITMEKDDICIDLQYMVPKVGYHSYTEDTGVEAGIRSCSPGEPTRVTAELAGEHNHTTVQLAGELTGAIVELAGELTGAMVKLTGQYNHTSVQLAGELTDVMVELAGELTRVMVELAGELTRVMVQLSGECR